MTIEKRKARSSSYQYLIAEKLISDKAWKFIGNHYKGGSQETPVELRELLLDLNESLFAKFQELAVFLAPRQREVFSAINIDSTQASMAKACGCDQSTIQHTLHGNWGDGRQNGGIRKRLTDLCKESTDIRDLCRLITDNLPDPAPSDIKLPTYAAIRYMFKPAEFETWLKGEDDATV